MNSFQPDNIWKFLFDHMVLYNNSVIKSNYATYSYKNLLEKVGVVSTLFDNHMPVGAKAAILCKYQINTAIALLMCWKSGMIPIPLSTHYGKEHYENIIRNIKPDVLITDMPDIQCCSINLMFDLETGMFSRSSGPDDINIETELSDVALIMCTSGTSGKPKGVMLTHSNLINNVKDICCYFQPSHGDTILIARPLYHCAVMVGEFLFSLIRGLNIHFYDGQYAPKTILKMTCDGVTTLCGTPTMLNHQAMFVKQSGEVMSHIKYIAVSGECLTDNVAKNIRKCFCEANIYSVYGLTEASPRVSYLPPSLFDDYPTSVGLPLNSVKIRIVDINGEEVAEGVDGCLQVTGPNIMKGYYMNKALTKSVISGHWLSTGDIAYIKNGLLYIKSRSDDMIIKAGMNIYPAEVENILSKLNFISEVLVYGIPKGDGWGIAAKVVLNDENRAYDAKTINKYVRQILPAYLYPDVLQVVDCIPKNASGKIIRKKDNL